MTVHKGLQQFLSHQTNFVQAFCSSNEHYIFESATGLGAIGAISQIIKETMSSSHDDEKLLVLSSPPSQKQMHYLCHEMGVRSDVIDRYRYRELIGHAGPRSKTWAQSGVSLVSIDFAKQEDILRDLCLVQWQLIVILEANELSGQRRAAVRKLIQSNPKARLLLFSNLPLDSKPNELGIGSFISVRWRSSEIRDENGNLVFKPQPTVLTIVQSEREDAENQFAKSIHQLSLILKDSGPSGIAAGELISRSLRSSPAAAEGALSRLRNRLCHGSLLCGLADAEEDLDGTSYDGNERTLPVTAMIIDRLNACLGRLEQPLKDSKLSLLTGLIDTAFCEVPEYSTCVTTNYRATLLYLQTRFEELALPVSTLHGAMSSDHQQSNLNKFRDQGGIILVTTPTLVGRTLPAVDSTFFYDLPQSEQLLQQIYESIQKYNSTKLLNLVVFLDQSDSQEILKGFQKLATTFI